MPVLHRYVDRDGSYVLTGIKGNIVTFQLTKNGEDRLLQTGVQAGQSFQRSLLLDLYRTGDAYTGGSGINSASLLPESGQLTFDFPDDPTSTDLFPSCSRCGSIDDLHLVEILRSKEIFSLLCHTCRGGSAERLDTSIPLPLVSLNVLSRVLEMKGIVQVEASVSNYRSLLESEFSKYWEAQLKKKKSKQDSLFAPAEGDLFSRDEK